MKNNSFKLNLTIKLLKIMNCITDYINKQFIKLLSNNYITEINGINEIKLNNPNLSVEILNKKIKQFYIKHKDKLNEDEIKIYDDINESYFNICDTFYYNKYHLLFYKTLQKNTSLTKLNLSSLNLHFNNNSIDLLGEALKYNKSIISLNLCETFITKIKSIAEALKINKTLKELNIHGNQIMDIHLLFDVLQYNTSLLKLNAGFTFDDTFKPFDLSIINNSIRKMILNNHTLQVLNLSNNVIDFKYLDVISSNTSLKELNINSCDNINLEIFINALHKNITLKKLYINNSLTVELDLNLISNLLNPKISNCQLEKICLKEIISTNSVTQKEINLFLNNIKSNKYIKTINLGGNSFDDSIYETITEFLKYNDINIKIDEDDYYDIEKDAF